MRNIVQLDKVSVHFGQRKVLKEINCNLQKNRIFAIVGPNAAGKTTFLHLLAGILLPSTGQVLFQGEPLSKRLRKAQKQIGLMPSTPPLYPELTVQEYLTHLAYCRGMPRLAVKEAVSRAIGQCHLQTVAHCLIEYLSSGYQRRVGIAQAIVHQPSLVLLDEPTAELDLTHRHYILNLLQGLCHQQTVVFSTHLLDEALQISDQVLILNDGGLSSKPFTSFKATLGQIYWVQFNAAPVREQLLAIPGILEVQVIGNAYQLLTEPHPLVIEHLLQKSLQESWGITELRPVQTEFTKTIWTTTTRGKTNVCSFASPA